MVVELDILKKRLIKHVSEGNIDEALIITRTLSDKIGVKNILELLKQGLIHFEDKYFKGAEKVPFTFTEIMVYETINECLKAVKDRIKDPESPKGKVVIGVIKGDVHDIGKNMVASMLQLDGYKVIDLGFDVNKEKFVEAIIEHKADILAISAFMPFAFIEIPEIIALLKERHLNEVKVIVGGGPITEYFTKKIGAAYARSASEAVDVVNNLIREGSA